MSATERSTTAFRILCVAAVAVTFFAWSNSLRNSFHFDDSHVIENNSFIRSLSSIPQFFSDARTFSSVQSNATWRPLLSVTYAVDYAIGGSLDPLVFHLTQIFLLLVLGALLTVLFLRLLDSAQPHPANRHAALFAATLFSVHTANTETMNLLSSRSDLLSTLFVVTALLLAMNRRTRRLQLHLLAIIAGAMVKLPAVFFAPIFLVYLFLYENDSSPSGERMRRSLLASAPSFAVGAFMVWLVNRMNAASWTSGAGDAAGYLRTQFWVLVHYLRLFLLPIGLTADTDMQLASSWYDVRVIAGVVTLVAILSVIALTARRQKTRPIAFGLAWFLIALAPTSLFPLAEVANEHRIFFPYVGLVLAATWTGVLLIHRLRGTMPAWQTRIRTGIVLAVGMILTLHVAGTRSRNEVWRTEETLWRDVSEKSPRNGRGLMNYGLTRMSRGQYAEARSLFQAAQRLTPNYSALEINLGVLENAAGNRQIAEQHFRRAVQLSPDASSHYFLARWLVDAGRANEALDHLDTAIRLSPAWSEPRELRIRAAAKAAPRSALVTPTYQSLYDAGLQKTSAGDDAAAINLYRQALRLRPDSADAWNSLGFSLARSGRFEEAAAPLTRALQLRKDFEVARNNLAWVRAELERRKLDSDPAPAKP